MAFSTNFLLLANKISDFIVMADNMVSKKKAKNRLMIVLYLIQLSLIGIGIRKLQNVSFRFRIMLFILFWLGFGFGKTECIGLVSQIDDSFGRSLKVIEIFVLKSFSIHL